MAEKNIKISGIGDVTREDFVRAITDPDKFREFADQQGWGNKRRQLAWNSLHNYAQGVQNGEINEINDMHQIVDDTGARTNKQEKYNWIGSKFDANGATAAFMNQIAKSMQAATKPADKSLKSIPSVTSYLNQQWFGNNNPDWELFQKNDTLTNGVYGIANRSAKIKEGLTKYKNELTTNGAQYNWDGVDKDALYKNLDAAIASSNVATYAPLGITSDYINSALATRDLSATATDIDNNTQVQQTTEDPTKGFSEEELAQYNTMTPEQQQRYLAQRNQIININNEKALSENQAKIDAVNKEKEDAAFKNWLKANGYYSPKAQATSYVSSRLVQSSMVDSKGKRVQSPAIPNAKKWDSDTEKNSFKPQEWDNFIHGDLTSDVHKTWALKNADRHTTNGDVAIRSKLDWLNYNFQQLLNTGKLNDIGDDVSRYVGASDGTVWRLKNSKRNSDGTYMYMRKRGNKLEFYRSKSWDDLRNNEYKKHISKHQWGGGISGGQAKLREQYSKDLEARQDAIKKQKAIQANSIERTPLRGQRDPNKVKAGQRELGSLGQLTAADKWQLVGIATDIGSTVASFFGPAGTVAGAIGGTAGTGMHAIADFKDPSVSTGEAFTNLGVNLLFDAAGAVPILGSYGKLAKLGRVGRALQNNIRLYKIILGTVTAPGVIQAAPNAASAVKKLVSDPTTITADELRDLSIAVSIATGMTKVAPNHNNIRTTNANYGQNVTVHTNRGKKTIPTKQYEAMMDKTKNPTMRDRNEALEAATKVKGIQFDNGVFHNYAPSSNNPFKLEGFYGKWGIISRLGNTSDPVPKYRYRSLEAVSRYNKMQKNKTSKPAQNQPTITSTPEKPLQPHNITPEQQKRDIELLRRRFTSSEPLPIDNATRRAYEDYRKRPMTDQEIVELEREQRAKRSTRASSKDYTTYDQQNAENRAAQNELLTSIKQEQRDIARGQQELQIARLRNQQKNYQENTLPEYIRAQANRQFALNWKPEEFKPELKGAARAKKQAMYERLFPPIDNTKKPKNTNTQHKQSNKKKKPSGNNNTKKHQNGGVLYDYEFLKSVHAFKQGGIIKAQGGIKTGVKVNPKTTWFDAVWSQNVNHILRGLSDNNYYIWLNSMQDKHGDLHKNAGTNFQTTPYNNKSVGDYQNLYKTGYNGEWADNNVGYNSLGIMHAQNLGRYDLYGNTKRTSGDWNIDADHRYKTDSSYSQITDDRRLLGRKGDFTDEQLKSVTEAFKSKGYNFALGKNDYYYLSPIEKSEQNQNAPKKDGSVTDPSIGKKSIFDKGKEYLSKLTSNPGNLYNAVETGKYLLANKATNDIFKIKAPNFVISPKHTSYQVMDNLAQQNAYHSKAAETVNQTSRPLTSSGQLQTAAQQESMNNANKLYLQGNIERNTWLEGQKQQSYKAGLYNMESAVDTANANAQQAYKTRMLNEYQDPRDRLRALATNRQNWINALEKFNVIDPYVERKNAQQQYGLAKAQWDYQNDPDVLVAQQKYQQVLRQHWNDLNFNAQDTNEFKALVEAQKAAGAKYYNNMYQVYGIKNPGFKYSTPLFKKKGGKFEDISKFNTKEFYNTVRHSINTATKQGGDLGKLINTLFKKSNKK